MILLGLLEPIWEKISKTPPAQGLYEGQQISTPKDYLKIFIAIDSEKKAHFLINPAPNRINRLNNLSLKGLLFELKKCEISGFGIDKYLTLSCSILDSSKRRPFSKFCEDILVELTKEDNIEHAVYKTYLRWKNFWNTPYEESFTEQWLKGLFGELLFIYKRLEKNDHKIIESWRGPDKDNYDFQRNNIAIEIKTTVTVPALIKVNNLNQMDDSYFENLWLIVVMITSSSQGETIVSLVNKIEKLIDSEYLDEFWKKLANTGYKRYFENAYISHGYIVNDVQWFEINKSFPRIISSDFKFPLDKRIKSISYSVELSGLDPIKDKKKIKKSMNLMCK